MSKLRTKILTSQQLLDVLAISPEHKPVKWLEISDKLVGYLRPSEALLIAKAGFYEGKCSPSRCHFIREIPDPRGTFAPNYHYLDDRGLPLLCMAQDLRSKWLQEVKIVSNQSS